MSYSTIAGIYDVLGKMVFGNALKTSANLFLSDVLNSKSLLILGGGTGQVLMELEKLKFKGAVTYVDMSEGMINRAKKRVVSYDVKFIISKIEGMEFDSRFDAVHAAFFFDQFDEAKITSIVDGLLTSCRPNSVWIVVDFISGANRYHFLLYKLMYLFFRITTEIESKKLPDLFGQLESSRLLPYKNSVHCNSMINATVMKRLSD